jgi:cell division septum initiation protein DivIVA
MQESSREESGAAAQTDIGSRVNAIVDAAAAAAERIGEDARRQAASILEEAEAKASERIAELTRESQELRDEADQYARDIREAADSYGTQHRRSAEEEALRIVAEAEGKATETLSAAQREADRIEGAVGVRYEDLKRETRLLEQRRQRALDGVRDLAAQLQDALVEPSEIGRREETLEEALDVERRR